ncbi:AAA family ATPase [Pradoshia sp. D12]|uniref:YhaN family protein n=1 Tax=Bacillaceae TaxID=186817 RepID=UPI00080AE7ED|nr:MULTISPECIES: YhaN family protein [Bacillaceae]OCA89810.1 hypothetical protein A8L44_02405 [Bacillus sp. FJAT-27986]QFK70793.1 AAA family ATPase [Pradoshia sp. D12]TPF72584.1 hypothetical protein FHY44_02210 [Bacillus sp. D12]
MRFEELNLTAFGHFTDYPVNFQPNQSLHVVYGNNEAGKSTMLRSITQLLYGIPHNSKDSFLHPNSNLRIKARLSNSSGNTLSFIRRKGKSKTILNEAGEALPDNVLLPYINVLSEETFRNMFALNHETLREGGEALLESNGSVGESLFAAASGINTVKKIMQEFDSASKELYKSGGSKPKINELLKKEKELTRRLNDSQMLARQWMQLEDDYLHGKKQLDELREHYLQVDATLKKLSKLNQAAPILIERDRLIEQQKSFTEIPDLPNDFNLQRENVLNELKHADENAKISNTEIMALEEKLAKLDIDEKLLTCESRIQSLFSQVGAYEKENKDLHVNEAKAEQALNRMNDILLKLGYSRVDSVNIEDFRIAISRKEKIRMLYKQYGILHETIKEINKRHESLKETVALKRAEWEGFGEVKNIAKLKLVLDHAQIEGNIEKTIDVLSEEMKDLKDKSMEELNYLPLWDGSVEEFDSFYISILEETINQYIGQLERFNEDKTNLERSIKVEKTIILEAEKSIAELEALSVIPTEDDLERTRQIRDHGWSLIKNKLKGEDIDREAIKEYCSQQEVEEKFEHDLKTTDELSDTMWKESAKVGMKNKSLQDIKRSETKIAAAETQLQFLKDEMNLFFQQWNELWQPFGIEPLSPTEMKEWVRKYTVIKQNQGEYKKKQKLWDELTEKRLAIKSRLYLALSEVIDDLDTQVSEWTLTDLIREANRVVHLATERFNEKNSLEKEWKSKAADLKQIEQELASKQSELVNWREAWEDATKPLQVESQAPIDYTMERLDKYNELTTTYDEWADINSKAKAGMLFVQDYVDHIRIVANTLQLPEPINIQSFIYDLTNQLQEQKKCKQNQLEWQGQLDKRKKEYRLAKDKKEMALNRLDELLQTASVKTIEEMQIIEDKYRQKQKLSAELINLEKVLLEIGNGLSIQEMKDEIDKLDLDFMESEMAELKAELADLEEKRTEQNQIFGVCRKEYEEKIKGNSYAAVQAAEERESILAELAELTDQYVQKKLATFVLQKGIEYFRSENQNPILTKASKLFAKLTLNSFEGLTVDYNEKDEEVLLGLRNNEKIGIDAMSDGTKDQLYLSLRVASIEKYCEENEPIPFIVDDILVHFDNERSKITLSILKELSKKTQVIFFTHHYHLLDLLEETLSHEEYQLIHIHKEAVMS